MTGRESGPSLERLAIGLHAIWQVYWYVVFNGALWLGEKIKRRKRDGGEPGGDTKPPDAPRKEHPRTTRLRREFRRKRHKT